MRCRLADRGMGDKGIERGQRCTKASKMIKIWIWVVEWYITSSFWTCWFDINETSQVDGLLTSDHPATVAHPTQAFANRHMIHLHTHSRFSMIHSWKNHEKPSKTISVIFCGLKTARILKNVLDNVRVIPLPFSNAFRWSIRVQYDTAHAELPVSSHHPFLCASKSAFAHPDRSTQHRSVEEVLQKSVSESGSAGECFEGSQAQGRLGSAH